MSERQLTSAARASAIDLVIEILPRTRVGLLSLDSAQVFIVFLFFNQSLLQPICLPTQNNFDLLLLAPFLCHASSVTEGNTGNQGQCKYCTNS